MPVGNIVWITGYRLALGEFALSLQRYRLTLKKLEL